MPRSSSEIKRRLFQRALEYGFVDPVTDNPPRSERALSGLLSLYAQQGSLTWAKIPLTDPQTQPTAANAATIIGTGGQFVCEYPLLHQNPLQERIWGWMAADIMYIPERSGSLVKFENKVGSGFHYEVDPATSQLGRQLDYLAAVRNRYESSVLILVTGREFIEANWYRTELSEAVGYGSRSADVSAFLMFWEDVFTAKRPNKAMHTDAASSPLSFSQ